MAAAKHRKPEPSIPEAVAVQGLPLPPQPGAMAAVAGAKPFHHRPERCRMVHLRQMRHLMGRNIIQHRRRGHDQPP